MPSRFRAFARRAYHSLPLSQRAKWRLRERLHPLVQSIQNAPNVGGMARGLVRSLRGTHNHSPLARDSALEWALADILARLATHAECFGPVTHWIALPFLATGGAERVAFNMCQALRALRPEQSVALLITDRALPAEAITLPEGVVLVRFDEHLGGEGSPRRRQALLRNLLLAVRPACLHTINSETAWQLIIAEGERLRRILRFHASIFAFQFAPDGRTRIGYAAYFLERALPHLTSLTSDNRRFIDDAIIEYRLDEAARARLHVLYQPCRLPDGAAASPAALPSNSASPARPRVLWAGRLDAEKRVDLLLDIVRDCSWVDFHVFGQGVLDGGDGLPALPNLRYEGPFSSPLQWLERHHFDAFLFTSKWEGLPNILLEAGTLGIPVIAPVVGGVGELITTQTGYPLPERPSVADYATALKAASDNRAEALGRAQRLQALIDRRHNWASFQAQVAALPGYLGPAAESEPIPASAPRVSVIVPCYNQASYLHECVTSALLAGGDSLEIIIVDDGSTETRTAHHLSEAEALAPGRVRIHRQTNQGLSSARNAGLALARGEFIQFLDADDLLIPGKLDAQLAQLGANPALDVSVCNFLLCDEARSTFSKPDETIADCDLEEADFLYRWERGLAIPIHCGLFRRRVLNGFDPQARAKEDWLLWVGLSLGGARFAYIHGHWAIYRQHPESMRRSYLNMGRAWLQAGLKIDTLLGGREPLFFESMVAWFEQCYRANPTYREEIARLQARGTSAADAPHPSEHVAQIRQSNVLRRYAEQIPASDDAPFKHIAAQDLPIDTAQLRAYWAQGLRCVADMRGPAQFAQINFLREFNSYFEHIEWDDPTVAAALLGYLWSPVILGKRT